MFYERFIELCNEKGVKPTPLVVELGLSSSNASQWKKGSIPRPEILQKIADYFEVTVGYLVGHENEKKPAVDFDSELIPGYSDLSEENKAKTREYIALLLGAQQKD